jgi:hypothetical protein
MPARRSTQFRIQIHARFGTLVAPHGGGDAGCGIKSGASIEQIATERDVLRGVRT